MKTNLKTWLLTAAVSGILAGISVPVQASSTPSGAPQPACSYAYSQANGSCEGSSEGKPIATRVIHALFGPSQPAESARKDDSTMDKVDYSNNPYWTPVDFGYIEANGEAGGGS